MITVRAVFKGKVQGVGLRETIRRYAVHLGVKGFARNLADGSLELIAQSERAVVDKLLEAIQKRPRGAIIKECLVTTLETEEQFTQFSIMSVK